MAHHPPPRYIFSFNEADPDVASLPAPQKAALGLRRTGLGQRRTQYDGDDEWVPDYGPTTQRRGRMRFVPAKVSAFGVIPASEEGGEMLGGEYEGKGKGKASEDLAEQELEEVLVAEEVVAEPGASTSAGPSVQRRALVPGPSVRGLYESIVGLSVHSAPASTNPSPSTSKRSTPPPPSSPRSTAIPSSLVPSTSTTPYPVASTSSTSSAVSSQTLQRSASPPSVSLAQQPTSETADIVLSSGSEDEGERPARRTRRDKRVKEEDSDSDDLVVIDPLTNLPEVPFRRSSSLPPPSSSSDTSQPSASRGTSNQSSPFGAFSAAAPSVKRLQPLLIHQLLPPSSTPSDSAGKPAGFKPLVPPTHYAIRPDSPGWQLLARQGWEEGQTLGPVTPEGEGRGLKVPLRPVEKHDRKGLGLGNGDDGGAKSGRKLTHEERERERRRKEREERDKRGRGERGMERMKKREERERKAMIAYMNR